MRLVPIALAAAGAIALLATSMPAQARPKHHHHHHRVWREHVVRRHHWHPRRLVVVPRHPRRHAGVHIAVPGLHVTIR